MATVDLPVIGEVETRWLWVAGAAVAGIVGYAWWARSRGGPIGADVTVDPATGAGEDGGGRPLSPPPGGTVDLTDGSINTNEEWANEVVQRLGEVGYEPGFVATAVGKYLARQPLNPDEVDVVRTAWALVGRPPESPPPITETPEPEPEPEPDPEPDPDPDPEPSGGGSGGGFKVAPVKTKKKYVTVVKFTTNNPPWNSTLSGIAARKGTTVSKLMKINPSIKNRDLIYPGQRIRYR